MGGGGPFKMWDLPGTCHTYSPSYLGGRDQEDQDLKPALENSLRDPILKILNSKQG
jgi:hypothetical protein